MDLDSALASQILASLQLAVLERREDGLFRTLGVIPPWLQSVLPGDVDAGAISLSETLPVLEFSFAGSLEELPDGGRLQSEIWTERDSEGNDRHLQALAMRVGEKLLLVIESPAAAQEARIMALQRAHDVQLQAERIERMRRELAALNDELRLRNAEVERATRAKSEFLAAMSHEIRTPMNAIIGMADVLQQTPLNADQRRYVEVFQRAGENLLVLINDILDLAKVEAGKIELESVAFDLSELLADVIEIIGVKAKSKGLTATAKMDPAVPTSLIGDPNRLRQVLLNLLGNSIKFTEKGGVDVSVHSKADAPGLLHFVVADTGIGIPADKLDTIFESFSQADSSTTRKYGGTGLGLSISRQLIELMQGRIWVESEPGCGSKFHFTAAFARQENSSQSATVVTSAIGPGVTRAPQGEPIASGLRLLLADDSKDNRFVILSFLKGIDCIVDIAENGRIAVEKFATGNYDLVLMDIEMPEMDGYTAVRTIRQQPDNKARLTPILALTAHAFQEASARSLEAGFNDHLVKPIRRHTLLDSIRKHAPLARVQVPEPTAAVEVDPLFADMIPGFLENRRRDVPKLAEALAAGDYETVRKLGHNLKGTGTSYGFDSLSEIGAHIEEAAKLQDQAAVQLKLEELKAYLASVQWTAASSPVEG